MSGDRIHGHEEQRAALRRLLEERSLPSTLLFAGPPGIGKRLAALELVRTLICDQAAESGVSSSTYGGCGTCRSCLLMRSGNYPDLRIVDLSDSEQGQIDSMRGLLYNLNLKAFGGRARIVVFDRAEELSVQAGNLLLKSLEEPRPDTYFILITSNRSKLLPTLLSRCHVSSFQPLTSEEMRGAVAALTAEDGRELTAAQRDDLIALSDGSLESFQSLAGGVERWRELLTALDEIAGGAESRALELAGRLAKDKGELPLVLRLLRLCVRMRMLEARRAPEQQRWAAALTNLIAAERLIFERNLGAAYVLGFIFTELLPAAEMDGAQLDAPRLLDRTVL